MIRGILGRKIGMTQIFDSDGNVVPVTVVEAGPCYVLGLMESPMKIKLGFEAAKESRMKKPQMGLFKKIGVAPLKQVKEFESTDNKIYQVGQEIKADLFKPGDFVDVSGVSKGKGFQGGMKLYHWRGGPASHGSTHHRRIGSAGSSADPSRTFKGHRMPKRMGDDNVTVQGLRIMDVNLENNLILIKGAVPGGKRAVISIYISKKRAFRALGEKQVTLEKARNPMKQSKAKAGGKK